jgi:acyl-CoA thioesterase-2
MLRRKRAMDEPRAPRECLAELLRIERRRRGASARLESFWGEAALGDLLARAVLAAERAPVAVHAAFHRAARPEVELTLESEAHASERTRVRVRDGDALLAEVWLRFGGARDGLAVQTLAPEAGLPEPDALPSEAALGAREGWAPFAVGPIESRRITPGAPVKDHEPAVWLGWLRPRAPLGADPLVHAAALAFVSEYRSHWAVERRLGADFPHTEITLLDHACWVHRHERWDDWWLVRTSNDVAAQGRALSRREIFTRGGALVACAVWEARLAPA